MSKLALRFIRETFYEFGLANCVYHPDDLPAFKIYPEDSDGSSGPRRIQQRFTGFDKAVDFA